MRLKQLNRIIFLLVCLQGFRFAYKEKVQQRTEDLWKSNIPGFGEVLLALAGTSEMEMLCASSSNTRKRGRYILVVSMISTLAVLSVLLVPGVLNFGAMETRVLLLSV